MIRDHSKVDATHVEETFREKPRQNQKGHRESYLSRGQTCAQLCGLSNADRVTGLSFQARKEIEPCALQRGEDSNENSSADAHCGRKHDGCRVDLELKNRMIGSEDGCNEAQRPLRDQYACHSAQCGEYEGLDKQLPH